jgi:succinoglycan biosynthesis transport protein ExoP
MNLQASLSEIGMQIRVRQKPVLSYKPVEPDKMKLMALGAILSLGIGLGLVVLAIFMDRSFTTVEQIERTLGLSVIGTLPTIQDDHFEKKKKIRIFRWAVIVLGILAIGAVGFLVIYPRLS